MAPEVAQMALEFLKRAELKGGEIDAFLTVVNELKKFIMPPTQPEETEDDV